MKKLLLVLLVLPALVFGQSIEKFNLKQLLNEHKLSHQHDEIVKNIANGGETGKNGISTVVKPFSNDEVGITWLKGVTFSTGTIDVDLRGRDSMQSSFIGIAFHGIDTGKYEGVYFRPFRFKFPDSSHFHSVQYISYPEYPWERLRKEHPLIYEYAVNPSPGGNDWFHTRIVVSDEWVTVYVNHSSRASLKVRRLSNRRTGKIGFYDVGVPADFANLVIKADKND